jgi:hypothetical protein
MNLQIGDRITDETDEWEVAGRPYTTVGGKNAGVRVRLIKQPTVTAIRVWGAHELVSATFGVARWVLKNGMRRRGHWLFLGSNHASAAIAQ